MNVLTSSGAIALLGGAVTAQVVADPVLIESGPYPIQRSIPAGIGGGAAAEVVALDPDGDLLTDLAVRWTNGDVTLCNAPEVLPSFTPLPVQYALDIAAVPATAVAAAGLGTNDGLLIADGAALRLLLADAAAPNGFALLPITSTPAWQAVTRIDLTRAASIWVLGVDSDQRTVRVGTLTVDGIADVGAFVAGDDVQQTVMLGGTDAGDQPVVAVRTSTGLELHAPTGALQLAVPAPSPGPLGAMCGLHDDGVQQLAWLARQGLSWRLRVYEGEVLLQDTQLTVPGPVPTRIRPIDLRAVRFATSESDALVVFHDTSEVQAVLTREDDVFAASADFQFPDIVYPTDTCHSAIADFDHDGLPDLASVLDSQHVVQIATITDPHPALALTGPGGTSWVPDMLPVDCSFGNTQNVDDRLVLRVEVPDLPPTALLHVVVWPQTVHCPTGLCGGPSEFQEEDTGTPVQNLLFTLLDNLQVPMVHPLIEVPLPLTNPQLPEQHYYLMLRLIERSPTGQILWTSNAQVFGFLASTTLTEPDSNYMVSISTPKEHPRVGVGGSINRTTGIIHKPIHVNPPPNPPKPPSPPAATTQSGGAW